MNLRKTLAETRDNWLTVQEAVNLLPEVSNRTLQAWLAAGKVEGAIQLPNGQWRIPIQSVAALLGMEVTNDQA